MLPFGNLEQGKRQMFITERAGGNTSRWAFLRSCYHHSPGWTISPRAVARQDNGELENGSVGNTEACNLPEDVLISRMNPVGYAEDLPML